MKLIAFLFVSAAAVINTDNMIIPAILIITGAIIFTTDCIRERKRTCKSGNFRKFSI